MSGKTYRVKQVARLAGVTVRTLHHYDAIGLLAPAGRSAAGYRLYGADDLLRLQHILLCRELGLPLEQIKRLLDDEAFDRRAALTEHRARLVRRLGETEAMIRSVDAALRSIEGGEEMDADELFAGFDPARHEEQARARWGDTDAYREAGRRTRGYSPRDWSRIKAEDEDLLKRLAACRGRGAAPDDDAVLELAEEHRLHIDRWYYPCDHRMHAGLAGLYLADERFAAHFDRHGEGLAAFVAEAIRANAARH